MLSSFIVMQQDVIPVSVKTFLILIIQHHALKKTKLLNFFKHLGLHFYDMYCGIVTYISLHS